MASRPRVIDRSDPRPFDALPFVCPACAAPLDGVRRNGLHAVPIACRCRNSRHTHVLYEMRCRACAEIIQLREVSNGFAVVGRGSVSNAVDRAAAVEAIERRFERDDER